MKKQIAEKPKTKLQKISTGGTLKKDQPPKEKSKELIVQQPKRMVLKHGAINPEEDEGVGQEAMKRGDLAIPRLVILQGLSDQVKKTEAGYIKGAEEGNICDVLNARLFDGEKGVNVIPVSYRRAHIEWKPRESGGGFVADHGSDDQVLLKTTRDDKNRNVLPNKNHIVVQGEYFVFLLEKDGSFCPFVIGMAGSQLKKSRQWNTIMNQLRIARTSGPGDFNPAMFYRSYNLSTIPERNDKGSWFGWKITPDKFVLDELANGPQIYTLAKDFRKNVTEGLIKAAPPQEVPVGESDHDAM